VHGDRPSERLSGCEFKVFSQRGEDGIIQYLVHNVPLRNRTFVEFGVEDYREANTRFLLIHDDWQGLVMDASPKNIETIRRDDIHWQHDLQARSAYVTRENINSLLSASGFDPDIGLLSIDIDGNDYWVWEAIEAMHPRLIICEYNAVFGCDPATIPYHPGFQRHAAHHSGLYFGASLAALAHVGREKGYVLLGCDSSGSNAFFVRSDLASSGVGMDAGAAYVHSHVRQSRDPRGKLTFERGTDRRAIIAHLPVVDVSSGETRQLGTQDRGRDS
jgi:hypothetical protein